MYAQILKQVTNNPNPSACCRGWEVLTGCAYVVKPSDGFMRPFVLKQAYKQRLDPTPIGALALRTYQRLLPSDVPRVGSVRIDRV